MTDSIFTRVFSYRQRENSTPLENFLTEILSYCLYNDILFRKDFFENILSVKLHKDEFNISTQEIYDTYGRPDIEITYDQTAILFECKVEATERKNQLNDYASILTNIRTKFKNKHIVYLTKYFEHTGLSDKTVELTPVRWYEVYELININHNDITRQLKSFLKEQKMEAAKNFTIQDLLALKTIPGTIAKMEEILEPFRRRLIKEFGPLKKQETLAGKYNGYSTFSYDKKQFYLVVGFWWDDDSEIPRFGLFFDLPKKKFENTILMDIFTKEFGNKKGWEIDDYTISFGKPITDFITQDEDNVPAMKRFIEVNLNTILDLRKKYPKLFRK